MTTSVANRLIALVERLPGPSVLWFVALGLVLMAAGQIITWLSGTRPLGELEPELILPPVLVAYIAWFLHALNRVAAQALREFAPALGQDEESITRWELRLTAIPDRAAITSVMLTYVVVAGVYFQFLRPLRTPIPIAIEAVSFVFWTTAVALLGIAVGHSLRQLRVVTHLHRIASNVDIFKPGPTNAFSRLTALSALGVLIIVVTFGVMSELEAARLGVAQPLPQVAEQVVIILLAAALFLVPLRGMHARLDSEKARLVGESQDRLKGTLEHFHQVVDTGDWPRVVSMREALAAILAEREVISRLPTWPWTTATFRGIASALLLPVAIFIITRVIERLLG